jgi:hypothetical protein
MRILRGLAIVGLGLMACGCQLAAQPAPGEPEARLPGGVERFAERIEISEAPCRQAIGEEASGRLVERCMAVSPATRPPCNALNPCDLIRSEIDRSCAGFSLGTRPQACGD